jgi:hypothetical protein
VTRAPRHDRLVRRPAHQPHATAHSPDARTRLPFRILYILFWKRNLLVSDMGGTRRGAALANAWVVSAQLWRSLPGAIPDSYHVISGRENSRRRQRCEWREPARDGQPLAAARGGSSPVTSRSHDRPTSYRNAGARSAASSPTWGARSERWFQDHVSEPLRPSTADHAPSLVPT